MRKTRLTDAEVKRDQQIRDKYKHKPSLADLEATGEYTVMTQAELWTMMELAAAIKKNRKRLGMSLAELSKKTGIDQAALSRLENGQVENPTYRTLQRVAKSLGLRLKLAFVKDQAPSPRG